LKNDQMLLFLKYFDVKEQKLRYFFLDWNNLTSY
jgi:hypothetical protein